LVWYVKEFLVGLVPAQSEKIVTEASASLASYEKLSIPADHQDMCKFASKNDVGYKRVSEVLQRWILKIGDLPKTEAKPDSPRV
jgi:hypothetical protein